MAGLSAPYGMHPDFELLVAWFCASRPRFWARVGHLVDPDLLEQKDAKLVVQAVRLLSRDLAGGPSSSILVVQRLSRLHADGKIDAGQVAAAVDMLDAVEDAGLPDEEQVVAELAPVIKRRMQQSAVMAAADEYTKAGDFEDVRRMLDKAARVGSAVVVGGAKVGAAGFGEIDALQNLAKLPTGILELDMQLDDGTARGQLGVALGDSGGGKSQFLISQAAEGLRRQLFVGVATLELPKPVQLARIFANLTGVPTKLILDNVQDRAEARRRVAVMEPHIGFGVVEEFSPHATSTADLIEWIDHQQSVAGRSMDLLVVDYADKLHEPRVKQVDNEYLAMRYVYEGLRRDIAVARNMWVWTASQATRPSKDSGKRLDLGHVADSMHKVRVSDLVLSLNPKDEGQQLIYYVAKNRMGRSRFQVGPIPTDWERGRSAPHVREWADWSVT